MGKRSALKAGELLAFPGLACHIESEIGRGSNAIVYQGWYEDQYHAGQRHDVLIKELFPLALNGAIYRDDEGRIAKTSEAELIYAMHRQSFEAGNAAHLALVQRRPDEVGANLNTFELNNTLYTVLGFSGGRTLEAEMKKPAQQLRVLAERMLKLLDSLEVFHESGLLHLDIAPDNVLLIGTGQRERVLLIDYNSCLRMKDVAVGRKVTPSIKPGYTAPEIRGRALSAISPASDIYSVTAVFFRMLTGRTLTAFEMSRPAPPEIAKSPCMRDVPGTVCSWVQHILRRGLAALPSRRYPDVAAMRVDLQELLDRIDGVGITHWALWETGWRNVDQKIRNNPSLSFIQDERSLYPANIEDEAESMSMKAWLKGLLTGERESALLVAGGGMGKTTALLQAAFSQPRKYAPDRSAMAYISLYGWQEGDRDFVLNRVLETLRFKAETHSYDDARKTLLELLKLPLTERGVPVLLLLLDGLNEITGNRKPLTDEILRLSQMRGVRILAASRVDEESLSFRKLRLTPLQESDLRAALSGAGLLMPEAEKMRDLLRVPLMLSIFILSSKAEEKQLGVRTQDELMLAYFSALRAKEMADQPENDEARWQVEAATDLVLPAMARELRKRQRALDDREQLPTVERCYRLLGARLLRRAFPCWIGRSTAIRGDAANAEAWYGRIVHDILWKRLGLLLRDDQGRYQVSHQVIEDYLLEIDGKNRRRIQRLQWIQWGLICAAVVASVALAILIWPRPNPYDEEMAEEVFNEAMDAFDAAGEQVEDMNKLLKFATEPPEDYAQQLEDYAQIYDPEMYQADDALTLLTDMLATGDVMPWSGKPMYELGCEQLLKFPYRLYKKNAKLVGELASVTTGDGAGETPSLNLKEWEDEVEDCSRAVAILHQCVIQPHEVGKYAPDNDTTKGGIDLALSMPLVNREIEAIQDLSMEELVEQLNEINQKWEALAAELAQ